MARDIGISTCKGVVGFFLVVQLVSHEILAVGESCRTPSGEEATCKPIRGCKILLDALKTKRTRELEFVRMSTCNFEPKNNPAVCCGTYLFDPPSTTTTTTTTTPATVIDNRDKVVIPEKPISSAQLPERDICGRQNPDERVFGGEETKLEEFPWMAIIRYRGRRDNLDKGFRCAGTIINKRFILTAAHCIPTEPTSDEAVSVRVGEHDYSKDSECILIFDYDECNSPVDIDIDRTIQHSYYSSRTGDNDIGLIRLKSEITYNDYIRPICLPPANLIVPPRGTPMYVAGWGTTENGTTSTRKLKVQLPIVDNSDCAKTLNDGITNIKANHVCAGGVQGKDACQGDSGGPLMNTYEHEVQNRLQWYQEGVVSRGHVCGKSNVPGIYTRVSRYVTWIVNQIKFVS